MHHRVALIVHRVHIRLVGQQQINHGQVALDDGQVERCEAILVRRLQQLGGCDRNTGGRHEVLASFRVLGGTVVQRVAVTSIPLPQQFRLFNDEMENDREQNSEISL